MEIDKMSELKEEPHLSGAYIRTLVRQLTTSRTKSPKDPVPDTAGAGRSNGQKTTKFSQGLTEPPQNHRGNPPQQHKKQVRRRLHSSKPYQERMLNMAEARREIVTALKFHRAAMKQANEQQHLSSPPSFEDEPKTKSRINSGFCPSPSNPCSWPVSATPFPSTDTLDFTLPNQTLGLSLNFQDFNNIETNLYHNSNNSSSSPYVTQQVPSVTSAWWLNFMKTMELGVPEPKPEEDEHGFQPFDQIMEFPAWLKSNDTGLQHHFNDVCPDDYFQVPALPCMDIGEIEGMDDVEWLA